MSDHAEAGTESRELCELLYRSLAKMVPGLNHSESERWCALYREDERRFVYVNHRKRMSRLEVWCLGDPSELQRNTPLHIFPRQRTTGGFGREFQCRFFLDSRSDVEAACQLLRSLT